MDGMDGMGCKMYVRWIVFQISALDPNPTNNTTLHYTTYCTIHEANQQQAKKKRVEAEKSPHRIASHRIAYIHTCAY